MSGKMPRTENTQTKTRIKMTIIFAARLNADDDGTYSFSTIRPSPYTVPEDGPAGVMLEAMGRHPWRPAHIHFKISAEGYQDLITENLPRRR